MKTIRRNSKAIKAILTSGYTVVCYDLSNYFLGEECKLSYVKDQYESMTFATAHTNGEIVKIRLHSNCWFVLTPEMAIA